MNVILTQSYQFHNCWSLIDESDHMVTISCDRIKSNGAFAADLCVKYAIENGHDIIGMHVQDDKSPFSDTNMDAAEGALYRAAHGAFDKVT